MSEYDKKRDPLNIIGDHDRTIDLRAASAGADPEPCPIEGCDELPEDHHHPARTNVSAKVDIQRLARAEHNRRMSVEAECHHGRAGNDCDIVARWDAAEYARLSVAPEASERRSGDE